ncbi:MAG: hypothetical protein C5S33_01430, partial [ANME-2 cluster archaeon]|nr:hypothetical protein [ANME-2 cluster archaeon]
MKFSSMIIAIAVLSLFTAIAVAVPAAPTNVDAKDVEGDDGGYINITWDKSDDDEINVTRYEILRATEQDGTYSSMGNTSSGNETYTDNTENGIDYYYKVSASDGTNSSSSNPTEEPVQSKDDKKPEITEVTNGTVTNSTAVITWKTHEDSTSRVEYGIESTSEDDNSSSSNVTSHEINLTGLNPSTTYKYVVNSTDEAGNTNTVGGNSFTTANDTIVDNIKPTVN